MALSIPSLHAWILCILFLLSASASGATRYVGSCGSPNSATIVAAVAVASAGDEVVICPGTYNEAVTVNLNNLVIRGSTGTASDVTVSNSGIPFTLNGSSPTLKDMTITSSNNRGVSRPWTSSASQATFSNLTISAKQYGIYVEVSTKVTMSNITVTSTSSNAIHLAWGANGAHEFDTIAATANSGRAIDSEQGGAVFRNLTLSAKNEALYLSPAYNAIFENITATSSDNAGIYLAWASPFSTLDFSNITVTSSARGIYINKSGKVTFNNVSVTSSNSDAIYMESGVSGAHEFRSMVVTAKNYGIYAYRGGKIFKDLSITSTNSGGIFMYSDYDTSFENVSVSAMNGIGINLGWATYNTDFTFSNVSLNAKNQGLYIDKSDVVTINGLTATSSDSDAIFFGHGASGSHNLSNMTLNAKESGIKFGGQVWATSMNAICVESGKYGIWINQWDSRNVTIQNSKFNTTTYGIQTDANPTYKTTVSGNCITKSSTPRALSNSTSHNFNGNHWQGVSGGVSYTDGNVRDNATLSSCAITSCGGASISPVADYRFDECSWTSGNAGAVIDSAAAYHGTPYSTTTAAGGVVQRAADLSASGTSDYIKWPISLMNGRNDFTVTLWFKTSVNQAQQEVFQGLGSSVANDAIEIYLKSTTQIVVNILDSADTAYTASTSFADGSWHHLAVSRSGSSACVYLDASLLGCNSYGSGSVSITNSDTLITGQEQDSYGGSFVSSQSLRGQIDEFKVFSVALSSTQISSIRSNELAGNNWDGTTRATACASLDHVEFVHDGTAVTCLSDPITVLGCKTSASCYGNMSNQHTGTLSITLPTISGTTWCADSNCSSTLSGTQSITAGSMLYLKNTAGGTVSLAGGTVTGATNGSVQCYNSASAIGPAVTAAACEMMFSDTGFIFTTSAGGTVQTIATQTSGLDAGVHYLRAVKSSSTTQACESALVGSNTVTIGYSCINPTSCTSGSYMNITPYNDTSPQATVALPATGSSLTLYFDANGNAPLSFNYLDVGNISLSASKFAGGALLKSLTGSSSTFVVRPYGFKLGSLDCNADDKTSSASGAFCVAGGTFTGTAQAVRYDASQTNNLGASTPNFGHETSAQTVVFVPATLVSPTSTAGGSLDSFTSATTGSFSGGSNTATVTMIWPNVGTITIKPNVDYLGTGDLTSNGITDSMAYAGNIGRFYPSYFALTDGAAAGFTYMDQPALGLAFKLTAHQKGSGKTTNYTYAVSGGYPVGTVSLVAENNNSGTDLSSRITGYALPNWTGGEYIFSASTAKFARGGSPDGSFDSLLIGAKLIDVDALISGRNMNALTSNDCVAAANCDSISIATASRVRYGRLHLPNFYGSELLAPRVEYRSEYWDGSRWLTNTLDTGVGATTIPCPLPFNAATCAISTGGLAVSAITGLTRGVGFITFNTAAAGSYDIAINLNTAGSDTSCNTTHSGFAANIPWLQGEWSGNCNGTAAWHQDPSARVRLGTSKSPYIYMRERY